MFKVGDKVRIVGDILGFKTNDTAVISYVQDPFVKVNGTDQQFNQGWWKLDDGPQVQKQSTTALEVQHGGGHYKGMKIQPVEFIHANNIGYMEGNAIKYLCRWQLKNGLEDLNKAKHYIELLIEMENARE